MNKILLGQDNVKEEIVDESLEIKCSKKQNNIDGYTLNVKVLKSSDLEILYDIKEEITCDINITVEKNITFNLYELKEKGEYKVSYKYDINENSLVNIYKINDTSKTIESLTINLNETNSEANYLLKTISKNKEQYDLMICHNASHTTSNIINNGVNTKKGKLIFNVSGFVPKGIKGCTVNQNNRIINLTDEKCQIMPNLFIDEYDVNANHSAHIGKCNDEELFYLMSRGINKKEAENLIIKGFLTKGLDIYKKAMNKIINQYWRWLLESWRLWSVENWNYLFW